jgi:hypothetical protein
VQNKLRQSQNVTCCCWFWLERANYHLWKLKIIDSTSFYPRRPTSGVLHHPKLQNIFRWYFQLQNHPILFISYCYDAQIKNEKCTSNTTTAIKIKSHILKETTCVTDPVTNKTTILQWTVQKSGDSVSSQYGQTAGVRQLGNEPLASTAVEHVFTNYHRLKASHHHLLLPS